MREKEWKRAGKNAICRGPKHQYSLFCICYAFLFKKKNASTAEHKYNAAIYPHPLISFYSPSYLLFCYFWDREEKKEEDKIGKLTKYTLHTRVSDELV